MLIFPGTRIMAAFLQDLLAGPPVGRKWTSAGPCLADHGMVLASHPKLLGAYLGLGGAAIEHPIIEEVMEACNTVNKCPYCDRLHGQMARIAGSACAGTTAPELYGKAFCGADGQSDEAEKAAWATLVTGEGDARATSVKALSTFLMWGSLTGNTVNGCKKKLVGLEAPAGLTAFELIYFCYYAPLFFVVYVVSLIVGLLPAMSSQAWFFKLMGSVLTFLSFIWILPLGLTGLILGTVIDLRGMGDGPGSTSGGKKE